VKNYDRQGNYRKEEYRCPVCKNNVKNINTAIAFREDSKPAHFDCILDSIGKEEEVNPNEKVSYIGRGIFAIVKMEARSRDSAGFKILKRIEYEDFEDPPVWRKSIIKK